MDITSRQTECLNFVFRHEGEGQILADSDGFTKWGICSKFYPGEDIVNMTKERASSILIKEYWPTGLTCPIDLIVFDASVNCGVSRSVRWLQATINGLIPRDHIQVDGILGPVTKAAIHFCEEHLLVLGLFHRRLLYYHTLRKTDRANYQGWIGRVIDLIGVTSKGCYVATLKL